MKKIYFFLIMAFVVFVFTGSVDATDYGKMWSKLPKAARLYFVRGFKIGYMQGIGDLFEQIFIHHKPKPLYPDDFGLNVKPAKVRDLDEAVIVDLMTEFYKDPANRLIHHGFICNLAIDKLKGATKEEIEKRLETLRSISSKK